jgi:hypothetical protein
VVDLVELLFPAAIWQGGISMTMTPDDPLSASPRGTSRAVLDFARTHGGQRLADVQSYAEEVYRLAPDVGLDPAIVVAQSAEETGNWTSVWWADRLNPAGIGITGSAAENAASGAWDSGVDAARAQIVHLFVYAVGPLPGGGPLAPFRALDPRYQAALDAGIAGSAPTISGLVGRWAQDPRYAANIVERGNAIFPNLPDTKPKQGGTSMVMFGRVPLPNFKDNLITDAENRCWDDLGPRNIKGVVYHRQLGSNSGTDAYFRTTPPGGLDNCPGPNDPPNYDWGGCNGLTDFGVDNSTGEILRWNDHTGAPHPGVSANRSAWASGPAAAPNGDGAAFLADNGGDIDVVNRDQVSIEIAGWYTDPESGHFVDDPVSDACKDSVAALSAYFADQFGIPWNTYPLVAGKDYNFTRWHNEFCGWNYKHCPGQLVMDETTDIINRTREILRQYQENGSNGDVGRFHAFPADRRFHALQGAVGRQQPNTGSPIVETFQTGVTIFCDGYLSGQRVNGDDCWVRTSGPRHLAIHVSGIVEPL